MGLIFTLVILLTCPLSAHTQTTWHVPDDFPTIQSAISDASVLDGDTVIVRPGTYVENVDFLGKGITLKSEHGAATTTIDGNRANSVVLFYSHEGSDSILDGFTLRNGYPQYPWSGGGISCQESSPSLINNRIIENEGWKGGGICMINCSPLVRNNLIAMNKADTEGGGIVCMYPECKARITGNVISDNMAMTGGGIVCYYSTPEITGNLILRNAGIHGGGIYCESGSPLIHGNRIMQNTGSSGGGISCNFASPPISDNWIVDNTATIRGGGIYFSISKSKVTNNTLVRNVANQEGGGLVCTSQSSIKIRNSILWNNDALKGSEISMASHSSSSLVVNYCDVEGWPESVYVHSSNTLDWGDDNLEADPLFVDLADNDLHLTYLSPCKDLGNNNAPGLSSLDFEGDPRIADGNVDMGADEFHPHLYYTGEAVPGGTIQAKCIGAPGSLVKGIIMGLNVLAPPLPCDYGLWYVDDPMQIILGLGPVPAHGVSVFPGLLPISPSGPYTVYLQAVIDMGLTNLCLVNVQ